MKNFAMGALALTVLAGVASADTIVYERSGSFGNNNGGTFQSVRSTFTPSVNRLTFEVVFSNQVTEGITLAINNGANPKGHNREMALFYLDGSDQNNEKLTAYVYSGQNNANSYQTEDLLESSVEVDWITSLDVSDDNVAGTRTFSFDVDVTDINGYSNDADWTGAQFTDAFGIWLHTFRDFDATYDQSNGPGRGGITDFVRSGEGWFDGSNFDVTVVPLPGVATMAGLGLAGIATRRRRA